MNPSMYAAGALALSSDEAVPSARPVLRLWVAGGLWFVLAAFPLLLALDAGHFSVGVLGAMLLRAGLGALAIVVARALRRKAKARLGVTRFVFAVAPIVMFVGHRVGGDMTLARTLRAQTRIKALGLRCVQMVPDVRP
jgi:hypothetical protein